MSRGLLSSPFALLLRGGGGELGLKRGNSANCGLREKGYFIQKHDMPLHLAKCLKLEKTEKWVKDLL